MKIFVRVFYCFGITVVAAFLAFGGWWLSREVNYSLSYKSMVEQTVRDMVKKEALRDTER